MPRYVSDKQRKLRQLRQAIVEEHAELTQLVETGDPLRFENLSKGLIAKKEKLAEVRAADESFTCGLCQHPKSLDVLVQIMVSGFHIHSENVDVDYPSGDARVLPICKGCNVAKRITPQISSDDRFPHVLEP